MYLHFHEQSYVGVILARDDCLSFVLSLMKCLKDLLCRVVIMDLLEVEATVTLTNVWCRNTLIPFNKLARILNVMNMLLQQYHEYVIQTLHDCSSQMNENLLISNSKLRSDNE